MISVYEIPSCIIYEMFNTCFYSQLATAFMLNLRYGIPVIMSGYSFKSPEQGPPTKLVGSTAPAACNNGWTCEHRDKMISKLVRAAYLGKCNLIQYNFSIIY